MNFSTQLEENLRESKKKKTVNRTKKLRKRRGSGTRITKAKDQESECERKQAEEKANIDSK